MLKHNWNQTTRKQCDSFFRCFVTTCVESTGLRNHMVMLDRYTFNDHYLVFDFSVVAKLIATGPVLEEDEHQMWLLSESADERYSSHFTVLLGQLGKDLHLIAVRQKIDQWIFYILCQSVEAVLNLAAFSVDGSSISLLSDFVTNVIRSKTVVLQSLNWPVVDYNRCLHVFYSSEG
jgi:hypothetical protein